MKLKIREILTQTQCDIDKVLQNRDQLAKEHKQALEQLLGAERINKKLEEDVQDYMDQIQGMQDVLKK